MRIASTAYAPESHLTISCQAACAVDTLLSATFYLVLAPDMFPGPHKTG